MKSTPNPNLLHSAIPASTSGALPSPPDDLKECLEEYASELSDLSFNSKPIINNLTIIAGENIHASQYIVQIIEARIFQVAPPQKLPLLYLLDSIVKNIGNTYHVLFDKNIVPIFCNTYASVDEATRLSMIKLLATWLTNSIFPHKTPTIQEWIKKSASTRKTEKQKEKIHVNPRVYGKTVAPSTLTQTTTTHIKHKPAARLDDLLKTISTTPAGMPGTAPGATHARKSAQPTRRIPSHVGTPSLLATPVPMTNNPTPNYGFSSLGAPTNDATQNLIYQLEQQIDYQLSQNQLSPADQSELAIQLQNLRNLQQQAAAAQMPSSLLPSPSLHPSSRNTKEQILTVLKRTLAGQTNFPSSTPSVLPPTSQSLLQPPNNIGLGMPQGISQQSHTLPPTPLGPSSLSSNTSFVSPPSSAYYPNQISKPAPPVFNTADLLNNLSQLGFLKPSIDSGNNNLMGNPSGSNSSVNSDQKKNVKEEKNESGSVLTLQSDMDDNLKKVIGRLYNDFSSQCGACGLRFDQKEKMDKHLDWHFSVNRKEKQKAKTVVSRMWFATADEWIYGSETPTKPGVPFVDTKQSPKEPTHNVPADESQTSCGICGEPFDMFWDGEVDDWLYRNTIRLGDQIFHYNCYKDSSPADNPVVGDASSTTTTSFSPSSSSSSLSSSSSSSISPPSSFYTNVQSSTNSFPSSFYPSSSSSPSIPFSNSNNLTPFPNSNPSLGSQSLINGGVGDSDCDNSNNVPSVSSMETGGVKLSGLVMDGGDVAYSLPLEYEQDDSLPGLDGDHSFGIKRDLNEIELGDSHPEPDKKKIRI